MSRSPPKSPKTATSRRTPNLQPPRLAERLGAEPIGLAVADEFVLDHVVLHLPLEIQGDVGRVADDVGIAGRFGVALGRAAGLDAVEEIADVERRRVAADFFHRPSGEQCRRAEANLAAVARFDPARLALEADRAGAEWNPALLAEDQLHAV